MADSKRDRFTEEHQRVLVGEAAQYLGQTFDEAADAVLTIMHDYQWSLAQALDYYRRTQAQRLRSKTRSHVEQREVFEVTGFKVPAVVLNHAMGLAGGDISRIQIQEDGSILVVNQSRRPE